jgi:hypothetical protein
MKKKLIPVLIGSKRHMDLIRAGFRTHHTDGVITWLVYCPEVAS